MRKLVLALAVMLAPSSLMQGEKPFDPSRDPEKDLQAAEQVAQREHKQILLDVGGNWCGWCKVFDKTAHSDAGLRDVLEKSYVVVHVNWSPDNQNRSFFQHYPRVPSYPFFFVLNDHGKVLTAQSSGEFETDHKVSNGYNVQKLKDFFTRWSTAEVS